MSQCTVSVKYKLTVTRIMTKKYISTLLYKNASEFTANGLLSINGDFHDKSRVYLRTKTSKKPFTRRSDWKGEKTYVRAVYSYFEKRRKKAHKCTRQDQKVV